MNQPEIEIVIPVYNEIEIIERLHSRVTATCMKLNRNFRITYIDDGSGDGTPTGNRLKDNGTLLRQPPITILRYREE